MNTDLDKSPVRLDIVAAPARDRHVGANESIPRWSAFSRLALGGLTFSMPVAASVLGLAGVVLGTKLPAAMIAVTLVFFFAHALIMFLYIAFAAQNPRLGRSRNAWLVALVVAGPVAIPAYWIIHVWRAPKVGRQHFDEVNSSGRVHDRAVLSQPAGSAHPVA